MNSNKIEEWKTIPNYKEHYQVNIIGEVRSLDRVIKDSINRERTYKGKKLSHFINKYGYPTCTLWSDSKGKNKSIHRLVAKTFIPNPENKPEVNHIDGNKENNHISNLEWVTKSENDLHAFKIGLRKVRKGEDSNFSKFTEEDVLEVRRRHKSGVQTQKSLAKEFGMSEGNVSQIINRKRWAWLK